MAPSDTWYLMDWVKSCKRRLDGASVETDNSWFRMVDYRVGVGGFL
jgi:hypothetical protein